MSSASLSEPGRPAAPGPAVPPDGGRPAGVYADCGRACPAALGGVLVTCAESGRVELAPGAAPLPPENGVPVDADDVDVGVGGPPKDDEDVARAGVGASCCRAAWRLN